MAVGLINRGLRGGSSLSTLALVGAGVAMSALLATPALAQDAAAAAPSTAAAPATDDQTQPQTQAPASSGDIVVTGSISRNAAAATASPVVSVTAADLQNRGISTVADALQLLSANNAGTAAPSWSSFGFASGASSPSLRGLNNAYTLTLFNGQRTAFYPLGDDGYRTFVDINTIPSSIVDRIDVLQDGASATYGSDAIAGVVNVIVKREITGLHLNGSAAISQRGDNGERKLSATAGYGKLDEQGFNIYVNGEYQKSDPLFLRDRGYPFHTSDQSRICGTAAQGCLANGIFNGIQYDGSYAGFQPTRVPFVAPYSPTLNQVGSYQILNPALGCQTLNSQTLTAAQRATSGPMTANGQPFGPGAVCQEDLTSEYTAYNSNITRKGLNARATIKLGSFGEAYVMANYYNASTSDNNAGPLGFTGRTAPGGVRTTVTAIYLPVYVCSAGVSSVVGGNLTASGCNAANGTLNPNNPFAAAGNLAGLFALVPETRAVTTDTKTYRFSGGINGVIGDGWNVALTGTASSVILKTKRTGYVYLQGLMDAIAKGTYNFLDQSQNTQAQHDAVIKPSYNRSISKLTQLQASIDKDLFKLPGGAVNVAVSGAFRYESINQPSANGPNNTAPNSRYYSLNAVSVVGNRRVWSAGYEVTLPIFDMLKVKAEGSYDSYSTSQKAFSPKFEAEFRPIEQIKLRGTYSKGFRAPSFSESFSLPTTGFAGATINCTTFVAFCAAHASNPSYLQPYSYGLTSSGNPTLKAERSQSFTAGVVLTPVPAITITTDFWQTKIKNVIIPAAASAAIISQYYTNNGVVTAPGFVVTKGAPDPLNPTALPLLGEIAASYQNANQFLARGFDFSISGRFQITNGMKWISSANASLLTRLQQTLGSGAVQRYDNSLGQCGITGCSGAPKWRGNWQNTLDFNGGGSISVTAYYTSGYSSIATDSGGVYGDCQASAGVQLVTYPNGDPVQCHTKSVFYLDGHGELKIQDRLTLYVDVKNLLNTKPTYDPNGAYGIYQFQPAWSDSLFIGRFFRVGAKVDF
ncbi:TonB-dependent receptor [Sphingomonas panacisoli]|uniref:TonB-dependent receptor n=2 Tax=Sphingomonas panacisoli TaxID=1813879 RepID=A0A5B8LL97_9SPHN|nr:TonB-dependent receptor [Sphingomonas panacisoli]